MVEWYLEQQGAEQYCRSPRLSNEYIAWPAVKDLCGDLSGKNVLDLGTAAAETAKKLYALGAHCTAIDISPIMLDIAQKSIPTLDITYLLRDCTNLHGVADNQFDIAVLNFLLCDINTKDKISSILQETYRVLKPGGKAVFTIHHPLQCMLPVEEIKTPPLVSNMGPSNYFSSGDEVIRKIRTVKFGIANVKNYHWTLEDYVTCFVDAGFLVDAIREPKPKDVPCEFQKIFELAYSLPFYVVVRGIKP